MASRVIVFPEARRVELREEPLGEPRPGQILVRARVSLISTGTEMFCFRGEFDESTTWSNWVKYPFEPGYSHVGEVVAVGDGVEGWAVGERVFSGASHREHTGIPADRRDLVKVPDGVSDEDAAWSALAYITQTGVRRVEHRLGDVAVIIGLGPLGQLVTQYLHLSGLREILAIDTVPSRLELAAGHGATQTFCGSAADAREFVLEHTHGRLADGVYDVTGHWAVLPLALPLARDFGTVLLLGDTPHPHKQHLTQDILARQVRLIGTHTAKLPGDQAWWSQARQAELFMEYVARGRMDAAALITHRFRPEQAPEAYALLDDRRTETLGVLFDWRAR